MRVAPRIENVVQRCTAEIGRERRLMKLKVVQAGNFEKSVVARNFQTTDCLHKKKQHVCRVFRRSTVIVMAIVNGLSRV